MEKIIEYAKKKCRITCNNCGALLEFEKEDAKIVQIGMNEYKQQIKCPACSEDVEVN